MVTALVLLRNNLDFEGTLDGIFVMRDELWTLLVCALD